MISLGFMRRSSALADLHRHRVRELMAQFILATAAFASFTSLSSLCPWNHLKTKNEWILNAHKERVPINKIMSAPYSTIPTMNAHLFPFRAANPKRMSAETHMADTA